MRKELFFSAKPRIRRNLSSKEKLDAIFTFTPLDIEITVENRSNIPLGSFEISDLTPPFEIKSTNRFKMNLRQQSKQVFNYTAIPKRSGAWIFAGIAVTITDARGYFSHQRLLPLLDRISVYPRMEPTLSFRGEGSAPGARRPGAARLLTSSRMGGAFDGLREYQANDPYKMIEWKASSRTLRLISKELETEHGSHIVFVLDSSSSMLVGKHGESKLDMATNIIATLAKMAIDKRDYVSLFVVGESLQQHIPPGKTASHLYRILEAVSNAYYNSLRDMYRTASHYAILQTVSTHLVETGLLGPSFHGGTARRISEILIESTDVSIKDIENVWSIVRKYAEDRNLPVTSELAFEPNRKNPRFIETFTDALSVVKDRAVFVILTDLEGLTPENELVNTLKLMKRSHHQVFLLFFSSTEFEDVSVPSRKNEAAEYAEKARDLIARAYEEEKEYFVEQLEAVGIKVVTLTPSDASAEVVAIMAR